MGNAAHRWARQDLTDDRFEHPSFRVPDEAEPVDDTFARECEAFVHGRYVEWAHDERVTVPLWAWVNRAAHGDRGAVEAHVRASEPIDQPRTLPDAALVLERALVERTGEDFRSMQRDVLMPLESELMTRLLSPRAILARVDHALE